MRQPSWRGLLLSERSGPLIKVLFVFIFSFAHGGSTDREREREREREILLWCFLGTNSFSFWVLKGRERVQQGEVTGRSKEGF